MRQLFAVTSFRGSILFASGSLREVLAFAYFLSLPEECITIINTEEVKNHE